MLCLWLLYAFLFSVTAAAFSPLLNTLGNRSLTVRPHLSSRSALTNFNFEGVARGARGLLKRQEEQCIPASYVPCANEPEFCCPAGYNCLPDYCCSTGVLKCGTACCLEGYACLGDSICCPSGWVQCGEGCIDPKVEKCCEGIDKSCPLNKNCVGSDLCCPSDWIQCGEGCIDPEEEKCCEGTDKTCPLNKDCVGGDLCCPSGHQKCGDEYCYDPTEEICCASGSCPKGDTCCEYECCKSAGTCGADGFCTAKATATPTATDSPTIPDTTVQETITFRYDANRKVKGKDGKLYDAQNRAVLRHMCDAIMKYTGQSSQEFEMTRASSTQRSANRKARCPPGYCADALKGYLQKYYKDGLPPEAQQAVVVAGSMSCDEFPFAISVEGGDLNKGSAICIPSGENSWQGGVMGNYFKGNRIPVGSKFKIVIEGFDCETGMPVRLRKRDNLNATGIDGSSLYREYDSANPDNNLLVLPLGDLDAGSYTVNVSVQSGTLDFSVLTYDGLPIDFTTGQDGVLSFSLSEPEYGLGVIGVTQNDDVEVSYQSERVDDAPKSSGLRIDCDPVFTASVLGILFLMSFLY